MEYKSNEKRSNTARLMHNEFTFTFSVNTLGDSYEQTCTKRHKNLSLAPQESRSNLLVYTKDFHVSYQKLTHNTVRGHYT